MASPTNEQSDDIGIFSVGVKLERSYSLQHVKLDAEASKYRYRNHSELNYSTINYAAAWDWKITPALHGLLSADRRQFRDISDTVIGREIGRRTERAEGLEAIYDIDGAWRALAGVSRTSTSTTVPVSWDASPTVRSALVGGGYEWASGSSLFGRYRHGTGEYNAPLSTVTSADFKEDEAEALLKWALTGKTSLDARLAYLRRTHSGVPTRDFSGPVGNATVTWLATGKTTVVAGLARYLGASGLDTGGNVESTRFFVGPVWKATAHTSVNARYDRTERKWRDVLPGTPESGRRDVTEATSIGIDWQPRRIVTLSASVRGERVNSSLASASYRNTAVAVALKINL